MNSYAFFSGFLDELEKLAKKREEAPPSQPQLMLVTPEMLQGYEEMPPPSLLEQAAAPAGLTGAGFATGVAATQLPKLKRKLLGEKTKKALPKGKSKGLWSSLMKRLRFRR